MKNTMYQSHSFGRQHFSPMFALSAHARFPNSPKVLLVEDNAMARYAEQLILESLGCEVITAEDGEQGLQSFHSKLQAVILDIDLPGISGMTVAKTIRKHNAQVPIIACTNSQRFSESEYLSAGFDLVLEKPMRIEQVYMSLVSCLHQQVH